ncbi:MAG: hypothetical protein ACK5L3_00465 [Oscillospiraceae bacterium]
MTVLEIAALPEFEAAVLQEGEKEITALYCADLLSWAMGRAPAGCAWCTIMGNANAVAVAMLAEVAVIVLCENAALDEAAAAKAAGQGVNIVKTGLPAFEAALLLARKAGLYGL